MVTHIQAANTLACLRPYPGRLYQHALLHLQHRRTWLPENDDRLHIASLQLQDQNNVAGEADIDWGEWGEPPDGVKEEETRSEGAADNTMPHDQLHSQQSQSAGSVGTLLEGAEVANKPYFAVLLCGGNAGT